jgi:hypothetical protein
VQRLGRLLDVISLAIGAGKKPALCASGEIDVAIARHNSATNNNNI